MAENGQLLMFRRSVSDDGGSFHPDACPASAYRWAHWLSFVVTGQLAAVMGVKPREEERIAELLRELEIHSNANGWDAGEIYFIKDESGRVKIGWSDDPERRIKEHQTGNAERLSIESRCPGTQDHEHKLHGILGEYRLTGEWFKGQPAVVYAAFLLSTWEPEPEFLRFAAELSKAIDG